MKFKYGSVFFALVFLAGCGNDATPVATSSKPNNPAVENSGSNAAAAQTAVEPKVKEGDRAKADASVPLANYTFLDQAGGDNWITYIAVSRANPQPSDEEKLSMFSAKYFNEADVFKKKELVSTELPSIQENLKQYRYQNYYAIKFNDIARWGKVIDPGINITGAYDFEKQGFPLGIGEQCWNLAVGNRQGVKLDFSNTGANLCTLKVADLEMAKKIEQLRTTNALFSDGIVYFHVDNIKDGNLVNATVTHMQINVYNGTPSDKKAQKIAAFGI